MKTSVVHLLCVFKGADTDSQTWRREPQFPCKEERQIIIILNGMQCYGRHIIATLRVTYFLIQYLSSRIHPWFHNRRCITVVNNKLTPWLESGSELYRPSDRQLSAKLMQTFADRGVSHDQCGGSPTAVISVYRPDFTRTLARSTSLKHSQKVLH
jgi:hypothetical protein